MNDQGTDTGTERSVDPVKSILDEVDVRARTTPRLKDYLTGLVTLVITDSGRTVTFDWRTQDLKIVEGAPPPVPAAASGEAATETEKRASIRVSTDNLIRISRGELNPQVAMLSGKVQVSGVAGLGMYIFNLIAPRQRI